jgi:flagellar L-ring protein precursor FlgH
MKKISILMVLSWLSVGCATTLPPQQAVVDPYYPVVPQQPMGAVIPTGSIFADSTGSRLFGNRRQFVVGDLVTVILDESTQARRSNGLEASKEGRNMPLKNLQSLIAAPLNATSGSWMKRQGRDVLKGTDFEDLTIESKGSGTARQAATLSGAISVMVTQVLPNDNLVIKGQKRLSLSEGSETVSLVGVIAVKDIQPDNTVLSSRIAGAQIAYQGTGELADFSKVNWGTQFFNKVWPF